MTTRSPLLACAAFGALALAGSAAHAAATAEVVKGVLRIRGDAADDQVAVTPSPDTPGMIRVEALGTLVNGSGFVDFGMVKALDVDLGAGDDVLAVGGVEGNRLALKGAKVVDDGGTLDVGFTGLDVKGNVELRLGAGADDVTFGDTTISGSLFADLDPRDGTGAADAFGVLNCQIGTMNVFFGPGDENPTIASSDVDAGSPTKFKNVVLDLGAGADFLAFDNAEVSGALRVLLGPGDDTFGLLYLTTIGANPPKIGSLDVDCGDGRDICVVGSNSTPGTVIGKAKFVGGGGNDVLALNNVEAGPVTADFGDGADQFATFAGTMKKPVHVTLGAGDDVLNLLDTQFVGQLVVAAGEGTNDDAQIRGATTFKLAPALTGFESDAGSGPGVLVQDDADAGNKLSFDPATGAYTLFLGGTSVSTGAATLKAKGGVLTVTSTDADYPFVTKVDFAKRSAKVVVRHMGMTTTITDSDTSDDS